MDLIEKNPYRIIGLLANSNEREFQARKGLINRHLSIGRILESEFNFPFLNPLELTEVIFNQAFSRVETYQDRVNNSLFWFIQTNNFDETAINYLKKGDKEKALEIWTKVTIGKDVNSKNFSYFNNLGTLKIAGASKEEIREGLETKIKLIESSNFIDFVNSVADAQTYTYTRQQQLEKFIDDVLSSLLQKFNRVEIADLFRNISESVNSYIIKKFTEGPIQEIELLLEQTKANRKNNGAHAYDYGRKLLNNSRDGLNSIEKLLGPSHLQFRMISDNVAKEILQCGIDSYSKGNKNDLSIKKAIELLKAAKLIAKTTVNIERIDSNLKELDDIQYADILFALEILKRLKEIVVDVNRNFSRQTLNINKINEFLTKELTRAILQKIATTNRSNYISEFIELAEYIRKNTTSSAIKVIINQFVDLLPKTHPFVISEIKRKEAEELKAKQLEEERKIREAVRKQKEEEDRVFFLKLLGALIVAVFIVGAIWGSGWAAAVFIIGLLIWGNMNK
jgi:hypothetical protein